MLGERMKTKLSRIWNKEKTDVGRVWGQKEKRTTEDEMAGWHH